jgi:uncharacterized protein (TIGR03086 family)
VTAGRASAPLTGGVALLERAIAYTLGGLLLVTPEALRNPTPCRGWDLHDLLWHMDDSLRALDEAIGGGRVALDSPASVDPAPGTGPASGDPVARLRSRACRMIGSWANATVPGPVAVADRAVSPEVVAAVGAVEVAVHGWDVMRACGRPAPVPAALAEELLDLGPLLVTEADLGTRFSPARHVDPSAAPGDRLVARLGRDPAA